MFFRLPALHVCACVFVCVSRRVVSAQYRSILSHRTLIPKAAKKCACAIGERHLMMMLLLLLQRLLLMLPCGCASSFALFYCWPINSNPNSNCVWALTRSLHFSKVNCNSNSNDSNSNISNSNFSNSSNFCCIFLICYNLFFLSVSHFCHACGNVLPKGF